MVGPKRKPFGLVQKQGTGNTKLESKLKLSKLRTKSTNLPHSWEGN